MSDKPTVWISDETATYTVVGPGAWGNEMIATVRPATRAELLAAVGLDGIDVEDLRLADVAMTRAIDRGPQEWICTDGQTFGVMHYALRKLLAAADREEESEAGREFHARMQKALGLSDEDYAELREIVSRRLAGKPHVHTRFCGHERGDER